MGDPGAFHLSSFNDVNKFDAALRNAIRRTLLPSTVGREAVFDRVPVVALQ
jgi:hypothetical protein